jgi:hypothetical protein
MPIAGLSLSLYPSLYPISPEKKVAVSHAFS